MIHSRLIWVIYIIFGQVWRRGMIVAEAVQGKAVYEQDVEVVERKGLGHPDSICDAIAETVSVALCRAYIAEFGTILHHNIDKGLLVAGKVERNFGGGRVLSPMELIIGDRADYGKGERRVPVAEIAVASAREWIGENLRFVDPARHMKFRVALAPGSEELTDIFRRPGRVLGANDTSAAVGYYPLSPTEKAVLDLERFLNGPDFKRRHPETGEDVKVMGLRRGRALSVVVAMPLLAALISSERAYFETKEAVEKEISGFLEGLSLFPFVEVQLNTLDRKGRGIHGIYLSLLGTSAEDADSGQVGRGNRVNGLISLNRPMGTEAAAGKNPVSHVGKIYNVFAHFAARRIYETLKGVKEVHVLLLSRIGQPIDRPMMALVRVLPETGDGNESVRKEAEGILAGELEGLGKFCFRLAAGEFPVC
jgi:S-adenosylmethionine synthetase